VGASVKTVKGWGWGCKASLGFRWGSNLDSRMDVALVVSLDRRPPQSKGSLVLSHAVAHEICAAVLLAKVNNHVAAVVVAVCALLHSG
jgi:hypothetical protein